jgi:hypothetical protein
MARLLNPAQEQKLVTFFEQLCADRANMQQLAWQMGGRCEVGGSKKLLIPRQ